VWNAESNRSCQKIVSWPGLLHIDLWWIANARVLSIQFCCVRIYPQCEPHCEQSEVHVHVLCRLNSNSVSSGYYFHIILVLDIVDLYYDYLCSVRRHGMGFMNEDEPQLSRYTYTFYVYSHHHHLSDTQSIILLVFPKI
jgi:hypothetical protein